MYQNNRHGPSLLPVSKVLMKSNREENRWFLVQNFYSCAFCVKEECFTHRAQVWSILSKNAIIACFAPKIHVLLDFFFFRHYGLGDLRISIYMDVFIEAYSTNVLFFPFKRQKRMV